MERKEWQHLSPIDQDQYEKKAEYLLDREYVTGLTVRQLAKRIYEKELN